MDKNKTASKKAIIELKRTIECQSDYAFAKKLNVTPSAIGRYTNGINSITLDKLEEFANQLDMTIELKFKKKIIPIFV